MDSDKQPALRDGLWEETGRFQLLYDAGWTGRQKGMHHNGGLWEGKHLDYRNKYLYLTDMSDKERRGASEAGTLVHLLSKVSLPWLSIKDINFGSVFVCCATHLGSLLNRFPNQFPQSPWKSAGKIDITLLKSSWKKSFQDGSVCSLLSTTKYSVIWWYDCQHTYIFQSIHSDCVHKAGCWKVQDDAVCVWSTGPCLLLITTVRHLVEAAITGATSVRIWVLHGCVVLVSPVYLSFTEAICIGLCLSPKSCRTLLLINLQLLQGDCAIGEVAGCFCLPVGSKSENKY